MLTGVWALSWLLLHSRYFLYLSELLLIDNTNFARVSLVNLEWLERDKQIVTVHPFLWQHDKPFAKNPPRGAAHYLTI